MGFDSCIARAALRLCDGDVESAVMRIVTDRSAVVSSITVEDQVPLDEGIPEMEHALPKWKAFKDYLKLGTGSCNWAFLFINPQ